MNKQKKEALFNNYEKKNSNKAMAKLLPFVIC